MEKILYNSYQDTRVLIIIPVFIIAFAMFIYWGIKLYKYAIHSYLIEKILFLGIPLLIFVVATIFLGKMAIRQCTGFYRCMNDEYQSLVLNKEDISVEYSPYRDTELYHISFKDNNGTPIKPVNSFYKDELEEFFSYGQFTIDYINYRDDTFIYRIIVETE